MSMMTKSFDGPPWVCLRDPQIRYVNSTPNAISIRLDLTCVPPKSDSAYNTFVLSMTMYPECLKRAQEEIDRVIGPGRLPCMADRPNLPYVNAVLKESLRWQTVAHMGGFRLRSGT